MQTSQICGKSKENTHENNKSHLSRRLSKALTTVIRLYVKNWILIDKENTCEIIKEL
jgi:hypothetical protein